MSGFKFFDYISEGKLIRNDSLQRMTYTDVCDLILLYFLALQTMRYYPSSKKYVKSYANEVLKWNDWYYHRMSGNDLYNLLNIVDGEERMLDKLKDPRSAKILRQRTHFPTLAVKRLLRDMANSKNAGPSDAGDLMKINTALKNSNYSAYRRKIANFNGLSDQDRKKAVTELEMSLKARGRNSDLLDYFIMFVSAYDLESNRAVDREPMISVSDPVEPDVKDINMLRLLGVPTKDLPFAYKVLSLASRGMAIPPRFATAYKPIMQIVDDIVKAGPGYVNLFKQVHKRAQSAKNR
tara:strand:+ start:704 stop:1585 length:882 start_codon:yes stop_codon:yes gene_type:complete